MAKKDKIAIMFVEGDTDKLLISLLLDKWLNFKYISKGPFMPNFDNSDKYDKYSWYENNKYKLLIINAQGVDNFGNTYELMKKQITDNDEVEKFIILTDADDRKDDKILKSVEFDKKVIFEKNKAKNNIIEYGLGKKTIQTYLKVIPDGKEGAIETVVLDALKVNEEEIVSETIDFVDNLSIKAKNYIKKNRYQLKAKMAISYTLIDPMNGFCELKKRFIQVDCNNKVISENFDFLKELFS